MSGDIFNSSRGIEVIVRGLLREEGAVLLCRNLASNYTYLPGGHVDFNEPAVHALKREYFEEAGIKVNVGDLLLTQEGRFTQNGRLRHELTLVFHVERDSRDPILSQEGYIAFEWVKFDQLIQVDCRPAALVSWLYSGIRRQTWQSCQ